MRRLALPLLALLSVACLAQPSSAAFTSDSHNRQQVTAAAVFPQAPSTAIGGVSVQALSTAPGDHTQISVGLQVTNTGTQPLALSHVTLRYWFTNDRGSGTLGVRCSYAAPPLSCSTVTRGTSAVDPARLGGDRTLDVGFTAGTLAPGAASGVAQVQVYRDGSPDPFDQTDDHSRTTSTTLADAPTVTAYVDGVLAWGTEPGPLPATQQIEVSHANLNASRSDNAINPGLAVTNTGTDAVDLGRVTVRYWFTRDGGASSFQSWTDYVPLGTPAPILRVVNLPQARPGADAYLEVSFPSVALAADSAVGPFQLRLNKTDWSAFDETDDHSYRASTTYAPSVTVTAYLDGRLVWGQEP